MIVLFADKLSAQAHARLQEAGCTIQSDPSLKEESLVSAIRQTGAQAIVVRSTRIRPDHLDASDTLKLVVRAGAGTNTIDVQGAFERGIHVANCPGRNAVAVAELAMGHILNADRRIADNVADLRRGQWKKKVYAKARGLKGRTLGVIGAGSIGREVIRRAQAFDMNIVAYDPFLTEDAAAQLNIQVASSAVDAASRCDVLTVHIALTPETRGSIGADIFEALPEGATFINTSRGEVVDEAALALAVRDRGLRAGLDVYCNEPPTDGEWQSPLAELPGVYGTHHIGASTDQAQDAVAEEVVRIISTFLQEGRVLNPVTP
ncbi:MAG: 3-phosphoglycerate dehydrogenase [Myxococcota bacterium]|nr:3-phosphoglycerate dehydrogenase [Myxococcota bacterium]